MSRIGKRPITVPKDVEVKIEGAKVVFKKGKAEKELDTMDRVVINFKDNELSFLSKGEDKASRAFWGTYRALASNIVIGLSEGFQKQLEINGVGYRAAVKGKTLELQLGFSHPINYPIPDGVEMQVEKNLLTIKGNDKQQIGQVSAEIRSYRPPEPYKGKGVKYVEERIIRKAGKAAKK